MTEEKTRFLEALRSGRYRQIYGEYKTDHGFCASGVYKDVVYVQHGFGEWTLSQDRVYGIKIISQGYGKYAADKHVLNRKTSMPPVVALWIIGMNDKLRLTFPQIADAIEASRWGE